MTLAKLTERAKLQSAMEYLMTYGWAILIIAVVLGALFQLGVFNSSSFSPRAPPGACQVFRPSGPGTTTNINLMGVCTGQLPQYVAQFNGASSYVDAGNPNVLNITGTQVTVSVWIKPNALPVDTIAIASKGRLGSGGNVEEGYTLYTYSNVAYFVIKNSTSFSRAQASVGLSTGNWYYLVGTYNGTSLRIYLNGVLSGTASGSGNIKPNYRSFDIGASSGLGIFQGSISGVQVYNASLSANQIQALYLEGIGGAPMKLQNLVGWWPLNGNSNDYSGNNNNGVPTAVTFTSQYGK